MEKTVLDRTLTDLVGQSSLWDYLEDQQDQPPSPEEEQESVSPDFFYFPKSIKSKTELENELKKWEETLTRDNFHKSIFLKKDSSGNINSINTKILCQMIADELIKNNSSQAKLAKYLGRSQSTLCGILQEPKEWEQLTEGGTQVYVRMMKWMEMPEKDRHDVLKYVVVDRERERENHRRRLSSFDEHGRKKTIFTTHQENVLRQMVRENSHPSVETRRKVAAQLGLTETQVKNFAKNWCKRHRGINE